MAIEPLPAGGVDRARGPTVPLCRQLDELAALVAGGRVVALTGAGISTESGIPDYRGPETRRRARNPVQYRAFARHESARRRYWARSMIGWPRVAAARPNRGHRALAALEQSGLVSGVITQNVDRLHGAAGSERIVELHGNLHEVRCLDCSAIEDRNAVQRRLLDLNPSFSPGAAALAPDGDADLSDARLERFRVAACLACSGTLKPNVVFFGESVPASTLESAWRTFDQAAVLLVVGSSLAIFSGFRFVHRAAERRLPIAIVNLGTTRGDGLAAIRLDRSAGEVLAGLAARLQAAPRPTVR